MNRAYKLVWSTSQQAWVVASELSKSHKKSKAVQLATLISILGGLFVSGAAWAVPAATALPTGESIASGSATFNRTVANQLTVNQSTARLITNWSSFNVGSAATVNFVQPDAASIVLNRVNSISPTEIFGKVTANGQLVIVNPNGMVFGADSQVSAASIVASVFNIQDSDFNSGNLLFSRGSAIGSIDNQGILTATAGSVSLLAPGVRNSGAINAATGNASIINADVVNLSTVDPAIITASSITGLIKNSGSIQAIRLGSTGGKIVLQGDTSQSNSAVELTGTLAAEDSAVNARQIKVAGVLDVNGSNNILKLNSISPYNLTFGSKINLNGTSSGFSVNGAAYTVVRDVNQLQGMGGGLAGKYALAGDVDASATSTWNSGAGFAPIGNGSSKFTGVLDGLGHAVNGLYINRPNTDYVGLIGASQNSTLQNIGLLGASIIGRNTVGGVAGDSYLSKVNNNHVIGSVTGVNGVGGVLGSGSYGSVINNYAIVNVTGNSGVGGLLGSGQNELINSSYTNGSVSGVDNVGGMIGFISYQSSINNSYSTSSITGTGSYAGGLVGYSYTAVGIDNSYATGSVSGNTLIGGLVGYQSYSSTINSSYASGRVSGSSNLGGLVGGNYNGSTVSNSYWDKDTTGQANAVGINSGSTLTNLISVYGNSATTPSAYNQSSYANLNFSNTWFMADGTSRPMLRTFLNTADADGKIAVSNLYQLQGMVANLAGNYYLTQDIDASATAASVAAGNLASPNRSDIWGGRGFAPIGNSTTPFTGKLDGWSHVVNGLNIKRTTNDIGLIGNSLNSTITGIGLNNVVISGVNNVGSLVGFISAGTGNVAQVGYSYATGSVNGNNNIGGLIGYVGAGTNGSASVNNSYATSTVSGANTIGGLLGLSAGNGGSATVTNSYASGNVFGSNSFVGGLVGYSGASNGGSSIVGTGFASGGVSGSLYVGGFVGYNDTGTVNNSYWDAAYSGQNNGVGVNNGGTVTNVVGLTSSQMTQLGSFANWGINIDAQGGTGSIWRIYEGQTAPLLRSFFKPLTATVNNVTKTYDGTNYSGSNGYSLSNPAAQLLGSAVYGGTSQGARHAGAYNISVSGLYSTQQGYDLKVDAGILSINKASLTISSADVTKTYDGSTSAAGSAVATAGTQVFSGDSLSGGSFAFDNKHAGIGKHITVSGVVVNDGNNGDNYNVSYADNTSSSINKADLTLSSSDVTKTYDGAVSANGSAVISSGALFDTDAISGGSFAFDNKHAGTGKHVTVSGVVVNDGNNGDNYNVSYADNSSSTINKADLLLTSSDVTKTYDGTVSANGGAVISSGALFDTDAISGGSFAFDNKNAGTGKHVTVSGVVVNDGNNGDNYNVSYVDNTSSTINKKLLTLTAVGDSKVYDGKLSSDGKPMLSGRQRGDSIVGLTQAFTDKNVGTGKTLHVNNYVIRDGNNGNNYDVVLVDEHSGVISPKLLTISAVANTKVYDGGLTSANKPAVTGLVAGDRVTGLFQQYETKVVGVNKKLLIKNGYVVQDGNSGNNYVVIQQSSTNGVITEH